MRCQDSNLVPLHGMPPKGEVDDGWSEYGLNTWLIYVSYALKAFVLVLVKYYIW